jgi:tetratricopeptide (TPR) repeat protein
MARKKRTPEAVVPTEEPKEKPQYRDAFQTTLTKKVEEAQKTLEGKGRTALYMIGALAVLLIAVGIFWRWSGANDAKAQAALGKAIETATSTVSDVPQPAGSTIKSFKTEKERAEAAIAEFQSVVDKFGGAVGEKAKYFIAVNRLSIDRAAAIGELEGLSKASGQVGTLAKFALAQAKASDGKLDEAAAFYQELAALADPVVSKDTVNFALAQIYEKQGKRTEAADIYFAIAKAATELKDADGKPVPLGTTARDAKDKVTELNPEKAKEIVEPTPESPFGGGNVPPILQQ